MMDEMREKIAEYLYGCIPASKVKGWEKASEPVRQFFMVSANNILSLETDTLRLAVVRKEGELPQCPISFEEAKVDGWDRCERYGYLQAQKDILNEGFVKEVKP